jgi:GT2 family glycosyltransferase
MSVVPLTEDVPNEDRRSKSPAAPSVSVVICTNRPGALAAAVASVLANEEPPFELLVVSQGAKADWAHEELAAHRDDARLRIVHDPERGLSHARNVGLREAVGEIVLFTDDDCIVAEDWVAAHVACHQERPDAVLVYGSVRPPADVNFLEGFVPTFDADEVQATAHLGIVLGIGANMSVRRDLFGRIGPFDEQLGAGAPLKSAEDMDLSYRVYAAGLVALADPRPLVVHALGFRRRGRESREIWRRDGIGGGALLAKLLRMGQWRAAWPMLAGMGEIWWEVIANVVRGHRPFGLAQVGMRTLGTLEGLALGLRQPLQKSPSGYVFTPK